MNDDRTVAPMMDLSATDSQLRADLHGELRDLLRPHLREMLREELRGLLADPAELRAALFARPAVLPSVGGTCTPGRLAKLDGSCNPSDSVLYDDGSGHLAIGTTTPNATFDIHTTTPGMMLSGSGAAFVLADGSWVTQGRFGTETGASAGPFMSSDVNGNRIKFYTTDGTGAVERMRITSDGKVGIGTSPATTLDVAGPARFQSYAKASLPSSGVSGRLARVSDSSHGVWMDTGSQWFGLSGEIFNVREFGATGDGTTDDTSSIQAAINAAEASRGQVLLPAGTYIVANLTGASNIQLKGQGVGATILRFKGGSTGDMITFEGKTSFAIRDIQWDLNNVSGAGGNIGIHVSPSGGGTPSSSFEITDCSVSNIAAATSTKFQYGISIVGANDFRIERNQIKLPSPSNQPSQAIATARTGSAESYDGVIQANLCDGSGIQADGHYMKVIGNIVRNFKFGGGITINPDFEDSTNYNHDNMIVNNQVYDSTGQDVNSTWPGGIENWGSQTIISGNACHSNSGNGIHVGGQKCLVSNNICFNNGASTDESNPDHFGINIYYLDSNFNANNSIYVGNRCFDTRAGGSKTQHYGIGDVSDGGTYCDSVVVGPNSLLGNLTAEVLIQGTNYALIETSSGNIGIGTAAPAAALDISGNLAIGGTEIISSGKVVKGNVGGCLLRFFNQNTRPSLGVSELANWYRPSDGKDGMLYNDGTNYWWWRAADGDTVVAEANP